MKIKQALMRLRIVLLGILCLTGSLNLMAQDATNVTGKVTDPSGNPLIGVTIIEKGTTNGTVSNLNGEYTITVESTNAVLGFSFVGYLKTDIPVNGQIRIDITLEEDLIGLDEVVVVGYGTQRKADLTGAVSTVEGDALIKGATPNITESLAGKISGVTAMSRSGQPGAEDVDFLIRGKSTFDDADNAPLVLVDGIERSMSRINPEDIESVTILKDAASASIYGVKGANGVILVTTKRAKEGEAEITYSGNFGIQSPLYIPEIMNSYQYATHLNEAIANIDERDGSTTNPEYGESEIRSFMDGTGTDTDWWGEVMNDNAPVQTHTLTISNGTNRIKYHTSFEYLDQQGMYDGSDYQRFNLRANVDGKITDNLSMSLNLAGRTGTRNQSAENSDVFQLLTVSYPTSPAYIDIDGVQQLHYNGLNSTPIGNAFNSGYDRHSTNVFESSMSLEYEVPFIEGLVARGTYAFDRTNLNNKNFLNYYTFYDGPDPVANLKQSISDHQLTQRMTERTRNTAQATLNYNRSFGDHNVGALFVYEQSDYQNEYIEVYRKGYTSTVLDQAFAGSKEGMDSDGKASETARQGYALRLNYNYMDKYLIQANTRYDKSFNFPKDKAGGWFPAFSAAWRLSNESFMENLSWLSNLKIRAGYGIYGNDRINPYQYLSLFGFSSFYSNASGLITSGGFTQGINPSVIPNTEVTWEEASIYNIGIDYAILNNKISGDIEVYKKRTEGLLLDRRDIPVEIGADIAPSNLGIVENHGIETTLRYKNNFGQLHFSTEGVLTYATSEIIEMSEAAGVTDELKQTGRPFNSRYGYIALGLFEDAADIANSPDQSYFGSYQSGDIKYKDINGDEVINADDRTYIGRSGMPELQIGINLYLSYKGFELSTNWSAASLYTFRFQPSPFVNKGNGIVAYTDAWTVDNKDASLPRNYLGNSENNNPASDFWLTDAWFLKLRNAELAYNIPNIGVIKKLGVKALRVHVSGNNLLSFTNIEDWDPEASDMGTHPLYYLQMRTINYGLRVTF